MAAAQSKSCLQVLVDVPKHPVDPRILLVIGPVWLEASVELHHLAQRFPNVGKGSGAHSRQDGGAVRRADRRARQQHRQSQHVRLDLVPEIAAAAAAHASHLADFGAGARCHLHVVAKGKGGALQNGAHQRRLAGGQREAEEHPARIGMPQRRAFPHHVREEDHARRCPALPAPPAGSADRMRRSSVPRRPAPRAVQAGRGTSAGSHPKRPWRRAAGGFPAGRAAWRSAPARSGRGRSG